MVYVFAVIADDMESYYGLKEGGGTELFACQLHSKSEEGLLKRSHVIAKSKVGS